MNDYDKAGRYLVKRAPAGVFGWLVRNPNLGFQVWVDARRVVLPNQNDLTQDLVAVVQGGGVREAVCLELEAEARADAVPRMLKYLTQFWTEPGGRLSVSVSCVSGVILDLTGHSPTRQLRLRSVLVPGCGLELTVLRRPLADEDAAALVTGVAAGDLTPWLLGIVPLMRGGDDVGIMVPWREAAERLLTDAHDRADLGTLTLTFATLARCRAAWDRGLRGWNMQTSPYLDEIRAKDRREMILHQGRLKFGRAPTKKQQKALEAVTDLAQLESLAARLLAVDSWADLLDGLP